MNGPKLVRRLLAAALLGMAVYGVFVVIRGYRAIGESLGAFHWSYFGLALALTTGNYLLRFLRWQFYLARLGVRGVPWLDSFLTFLSGFVLTVTPGKVGEVFKSLVLAETQGVDAARTAPIVVAERLTDLIGVVVLVLIGSAGFAGGRHWALAGGAVVLAVLVLISWQRVPDAVVAALGRSKVGALRAMAPRVEAAWSSLRQLTSPGVLVLPALLAIVGWSLEGLSLWILVKGFGATMSLPLALFAYATSQLAGALVPVPGGLGITEGSLEQQLVRLGGVAPPVATSAMILIRLATLWYAVVLGFIALGLLRMRFPRLLAAPEPPRDVVMGEPADKQP